MRYAVVLVSVSVCVLFAQPSWGAGCDGILSLTRNLNYNQKSIVIAQDIYSEYCSGDQLKSDASFDLGIEAVIEQVPIGLKLGSGSTQEKASHLCYKYKDWYSNNSESISIAVSTDDHAIQAWKTCKELEKEEVFFSVNPSRELIGFGVRRGADIINFLGMNYDSADMTCFGPFGKDGEQTLIDDKTQFTLTSAKEQPITCRRTLQVASDGLEFLPQTEVAIMAEGRSPLIIPLPRDEVYEPSHSSELKTVLESLSHELAGTKEYLTNTKSSLSTEIASVRAAHESFVSNLRIKTSLAVISDRPSEGFVHLGCGDVNTYASGFCGSKHAFIHEISRRGGGGCGITHFAVSCIE